MVTDISENKLVINCGLACLIKDKAGILDKYNKVTVNCGTFIASSEISAKLAEKGATINAGSSHVQDIRGEIVQISSGRIIDGKADYKDLFILAMGDVILRGDGAKSIGFAEGMIVKGTLYYPDSTDLGLLSSVKGDLKAYPEDAHIVLGNHDIAHILHNTPRDKKHVWISGKVTALDEKALKVAKERGLFVTSASLITYEGYHNTYGEMWQAAEKILVPDGYEITGDLFLSAAQIALYGTRLYVKGDLTLAQKDIACLDDAESIIVTGCANIPVSAAKAFRKVGKAKRYFAYEGLLCDINGFNQFTHAQMQAMLASGVKTTLRMNGCLRFTEDVTAEDIEAIEALYFNGTVLLPSAAKGALSARIRQTNTFMGNLGAMQELTDLPLEDMKKQMTGDESGSSINTGSYFLI